MTPTMDQLVDLSSTGTKMPDPYFFLSYAREDREGDPYEVIDRFYGDLTRAIGGRIGRSADEVGFRDTTDVRTGDRWPGAIENALRTCRAFVLILSPRYLTRPYCGKEWAAFNDRLSESNASLIQPVLLLSRDYLRGPPEVTEIADSDDKLPELYRTNGLDVLVRHLEEKAYQAFVTAFATRLFEVAEAHPLAPAGAIRPLDEIQSAFHGDSGPGLDLPAARDDEGPRFANVMLVAASRAEVAAIRTVTEGYGDQGPVAWRPWHPEDRDHVSRIVGEIALQEGFLPAWVDTDDSSPQHIKDAFDRGNVVVVVADVWTLSLDWYRRCMRKIDESGFMNCVVAVLWNDRDNDTAASAAMLGDAVQLAFANRFALNDPTIFLNRVSSAEDLRKRLAIALAKAGSRVTEYHQTHRRAEGQAIVAKPELAIAIGDRH
jgi:FxsC-like protein